MPRKKDPPNDAIGKEDIMKTRTKIAGLACMVTLASAVAVPTAFAAGGYGKDFTDLNGDGVCDTYATSSETFTDHETGIGIDDANSSENGTADSSNAVAQGAGNFVDQNGDGICDNCPNGNQKGTFVDQNGDGICDNAGTGQGYDARGGCGHRAGR